jgi:tRNA A-37 threonylcarbamoyl transferase component Bud32
VRTEPADDVQVAGGWREVRHWLSGFASGAGRAFLADPQAVFATGQVLKAGNTAAVRRVSVEGHSWIVKRYNVKGLGHRLRQSLKPRSRARNAWRWGQHLHAAGVPTARPLALLEHRCGPLRGAAYLVMEDLGDRSLRDAVGAGPPLAAWVAAVTELFLELQRLGLAHGDTKATNFIVVGERVALIDLDAMRAEPRGLARDLRRFLDNWTDQPAVRDAFAGAFRAADLPLT